MRKTIIFTFLTIIILISICWVWAAKGPITITVTYNNLKIIVDGAPLQTTEEPFIMKNGKIFASIDDIAKALDKPIKYDAKVTTLFIGRQPSKSWSYLSDLEPIQWLGGTFKTNPGEKGESFSIAGKKYTKGIRFHSIYYEKEIIIEYNLAGEYSRLTGEIGIDDESRGSDNYASFYIYTDENLVSPPKELKAGSLPFPIDIDVSNVIRLKIKVIPHCLKCNFVNVILTR